MNTAPLCFFLGGFYQFSEFRTKRGSSSRVVEVSTFKVLFYFEVNPSRKFILVWGPGGLQGGRPTQNVPQLFRHTSV